MASVKDRKAAMGFMAKAPMCCNCAHYVTEEKGHVKGWDGKWRPARISYTCKIGEFAVMPPGYSRSYKSQQNKS